MVLPRRRIGVSLFARFAFALWATACGDIGRVVVAVRFADETTERRTRALEVVVREVGVVGSGCVDVWDRRPTGLPEDRALVVYPNRVDIRASPVDLGGYTALTVRIYAFDTLAVEGAEPLAAGCTDASINMDATTHIAVELRAR